VSLRIVAAGVNLNHASLDVLERVHADERALGRAAERVILRTCNRTEVYAVAPAGAEGCARAAFGEAPAFEMEGEEAVRHLFGVASGVDSVVIGESQILDQVERAGERADGPVLASLFGHAVHAGRRARAETNIELVGSTLPRAAVALATSYAGPLRDRAALVVGAGTMGDLLAEEVAATGARLTIANRTPSRALKVARRLGASALDLSELSAAIARADVVFSIAASARGLITPEIISREVLIVDLAVPRNAAPEVSSLPGVRVLDMEDLRCTLTPRAVQMDEIDHVGRIVDEEASLFVRRTLRKGA
jgi:glutamyl-tRNA reductase